MDLNLSDNLMESQQLSRKLANEKVAPWAR
jgi:hypothetical protein